MRILKVMKLHPEAKLPERAFPTDAGLDLYALNDVYCDIHGMCTVPTGIALDIKPGYFAMICDKSSIARIGFKVNAGVVDSGYIGEVSVELMNVIGTSKLIKKGQKVAQVILLPIATPKVIEVESLAKTKRGTKGFGSSGSF